jgi:hypothetical protein
MPLFLEFHIFFNPKNTIKSIIYILSKSKKLSHNTLANSVRQHSFSLFFCGILRCWAATSAGAHSRPPEKEQNNGKTYLLK